LTCLCRRLSHARPSNANLDKMRYSSWLLFGLHGLAASSPLTTHSVHEKRDALPVAWNKHSRAARDAVLPVRIGLKQRNLEHSDRFLEDVSDPDSPNFGKNRLDMLGTNTVNSMLQEIIGPLNKLPTCLRRTRRLRTPPLTGSLSPALTAVASSTPRVSKDLSSNSNTVLIGR
jgi:hypothetical protein